MSPILNWPKLDVPVTIGWYLDELYGVLMPSHIWNKPLAEIDNKIKSYMPRNPEGWDLACKDMRDHGMEEFIITLRFWMQLAFLEDNLLQHPESEKIPEVLGQYMKKYGDPDVMIITGRLNNIMPLLHFQTTWSHMLYQHGNLMPIRGKMFEVILESLKDFNTTTFSKFKLKQYVESVMEANESDEKPIEALDNAHLKIISIVVKRL